MKKLKQILAIIAIVILVGMYIATFVLSLVLPDYAMNFLFASIAATVFIPIVLWIFIAFYKWITGDRDTLAKENKEIIESASKELDEEESNKEE